MDYHKIYTIKNITLYNLHCDWAQDIKVLHKLQSATIIYNRTKGREGVNDDFLNICFASTMHLEIW